MIYGRVQGVGFRRFVVSVALKCCLDGWVKNTQDGCVEVFAKGKTENIVKLIDACREGPFFSSVNDLRFLDDADALFEQSKQLRGFFIQR